ncbi:MAG: SDR family oxidoreductase [Candidatus Woesebacteria bacterium]|jgi:dTDP-4-dehydrorhamnose reductase
MTKQDKKLIPLLTTGLNGLVGSKFAADFADKYRFENLDLRHSKNPTDITKYEQVIKKFKQSAAKSVIHLAAFTNVSAAWEQLADKKGIAYQVNVKGTENIVRACQETGKHLIHISTAYVFDGEKKGLYKETDKTHAIEWYGETKLIAEKIVQAADLRWTVLRIDQPFRSDDFEKIDIVHRIINGLKNKNLYPQFVDHYFGPTFVDDFAKILDFFVRAKTTGLFHASSGEKWSDFDFANLVKQSLKLEGKITEGKLDDYLKKTKRPYQRNTALDSKKLKKVLDFKMKSIREAIREIKL